MKLIEEFLALKRIAVVGVSQRPQDFSRMLFRELASRGYDVVPVHPAAQEIEGKQCFPNVQEIFPPVEGALVMTRPAVTYTVVRDCVAAGVGRVWMWGGAGKGAVSSEALALAEIRKLRVIAGECPFMFLPAAGWIHRLHGMVLKIAGTYPA